jgi:hypothetical protein
VPHQLRDVGLFGGTVLTTSIGSDILGRLPASQVTQSGQQGLANLGSFFPVQGSLLGAQMTLSQLRRLQDVAMARRYGRRQRFY